MAHLIMEDGTSIILETSWALNTPEEHDIKTVLSGRRAGADNINGLRINGERDGIYKSAASGEAYHF